MSFAQVSHRLRLPFDLRFKTMMKKSNHGYDWFAADLKRVLHTLKKERVLLFTIWNLRRFRTECRGEAELPIDLLRIIDREQMIEMVPKPNLLSMKDTIVHLYESDQDITCLRANYYELLLNFLDVAINGLQEKDLVNIAMDSALRLISVKEYDLTVIYGTIPLESTFEIPELEDERLRQFKMLKSHQLSNVDYRW